MVAEAGGSSIYAPEDSIIPSIPLVVSGRGQRRLDPRGERGASAIDIRHLLLYRLAYDRRISNQRIGV